MSEYSDLSTRENSRKSSNGFPKMFQLKLDEVDREERMKLPLNSKTKSENLSPLRFQDDLYAYRTSTKWPPITRTWPFMDPETSSTESPNRIIIADFEKKLDHALENFQNNWSNQQERLNNYNNDFANRIKRIDLQLKVPSLKRPDVHTYEHRSFLYGFVTIGCGVGIIFLLFLFIFSAKKKNRNQPGPVLPTGRVIGQGAVQRNQEIPMQSPGQGGAVPSNIGMPYSNCFNKNFDEEPPPYPKDTEPLVQNNGLVEMGFQNECVAMETAPNLETEFVTDSGRTVESLNSGMQKNRAEQGTRHADDKDSVNYVDEKSFLN